MRDASFNCHLYLEMEEGQSVEEAEEKIRGILGEIQMKMSGFSYEIHEIEEQKI